MSDDERYYTIVSRIPYGRVTTYGEVARAAGRPRRARAVGRALATIPDDVEIPWHRVVNAGGGISPRGDDDACREQRARLRAEGIEFGPNGRIDLTRFGWRAPVA